MLVTRNLAAGNLSYAAGGSRSPFVPLGVNKCEGWTPSQSGGWCAPGDAGLSQTSIDTSTVWVAAGYIPSADGETLYMYYAGTPYTHAGGGDARHGWGNNTGIGLLKLRVDGFVALEAPYDFSQPRPSFATTAVWVPGKGLLSRFCATIRGMRDSNREIYGTNRESVCINQVAPAALAMPHRTC
eukprot:SAG31_NODE_1182_length_9512_cov_3.773611_3_plen_184_part_00